MSFDQFLPDYGILPSKYFERSVISNPIELFWSHDVVALLRLCGAKEEMIGERASDYDRFLSVCRALPLLEGHPTRAWIASLLDQYFGVRELPTEENAQDVWKMLCEHLWEFPIAPKDLVIGSWLCDTLTIPSALPQNLIPVLSGNLLLNTTSKKAIEWSAEIDTTVAQFAKKGCEKIVVQLQKNFEFALPSLYGVDRALSLAKCDREAINLLTCQLVRELCVVAQKHDLLLVLVCNGNSADLVNLVEYAEESVGLPRICWSTREVREASALLDFSAKPHKNEMLAALPYECVMTKNELSLAIESWQMRYPVGRMCFITARDLRQTPYAQAHIQNMLEKGKTKI